MILTIVFIPLLNFLMFASIGKLIHRKYLIFYCLSSFFIIASLLFRLTVNIIENTTKTVEIGSWASSGLLDLKWDFFVDSLSFVMLVTVISISTVVHIYSTDYMKNDPHFIRFISYLSLFTFFMLILVTADNFITLFLGWEGVGLCSYLLISFWFTRVQANKAAIKAMVMNRIADLAYVLAVVITFYTFQTLDFASVFCLTTFLKTTKVICGGVEICALTVITFLFFIGASGKSAQLGLHTWLPDAMEGPTPVSALIHAATMVTAGVFLIVRCSCLFEAAPVTLFIVTAIGGGTAFTAATAGLLQNDLKKVIAYSTCSQLGYMIFVCGLSQYNLSLFHLSNHAFFKALLFLSAGAVIHGVSNEQDLRKQGGLIKVLPYTYAMFLIGSLSLMGFPFLTGYYSKDLIIENAFSASDVTSKFVYSVGLITALLTAYYSFRLLYLTFYDHPKGFRVYLMKTHDVALLVAASLSLLAFGSIFLGYLSKDLMIGLGTTFWNGVISVSFETNQKLLEAEFLPLIIKLAPFYGSLIAISILLLSSTLKKQTLANSYVSHNLRVVYNFFSHKWYFDTVYNKLINQPILEGTYRIIFVLIDRGLLEILGPTGIIKRVLQTGKLLIQLQTGRVQDYAGLLVVFTYLYSTLFK